jgi:hypothetical protein
VWRIRNNAELDQVINGADIVRFIKAKRVNGWVTYKEWTLQGQQKGYLNGNQ